MTEQSLLNYFLNIATVDELKEDLEVSQQKTNNQSTFVYVIQIDSGNEFIIIKDHLIKLCDDAISGKLTTIDLNAITFAIISSDFFYLGQRS